MSTIVDAISSIYFCANKVQIIAIKAMYLPPLSFRKHHRNNRRDRIQNSSDDHVGDEAVFEVCKVA